MTESEKLDAGLEYDFWDAGINARKAGAMVLCQKLNALDSQDLQIQKYPGVSWLWGI